MVQGYQHIYTTNLSVSLMSRYITKLNKISNTASSLTASHYCENQNWTQDSILT